MARNSPNSTPVQDAASGRRALRLSTPSNKRKRHSAEQNQRSKDAEKRVPHTLFKRPRDSPVKQESKIILDLSLDNVFVYPYKYELDEALCVCLLKNMMQPATTYPPTSRYHVSNASEAVLLDLLRRMCVKNMLSDKAISGLEGLSQKYFLAREMGYHHGNDSANGNNRQAGDDTTAAATNNDKASTHCRSQSGMGNHRGDEKGDKEVGVSNQDCSPIPIHIKITNEEFIVHFNTKGKGKQGKGGEKAREDGSCDCDEEEYSLWDAGEYKLGETYVPRLSEVALWSLLESH